MGTGMLAAVAFAQPGSQIASLSSTPVVSSSSSASSLPELPDVASIAPILPPGVAGGQEPSADAREVRTAIEDANTLWLKAFHDGDEVALAGIYAADASLFPPSNQSLEGRDRIVEYFDAQRRAGMGDATLKTLDVVRAGDVAYEVGTYGFRFHNPGADGREDSGRYFTIWKNQGDGSWRYQVGIWSSNRDVASTEKHH
ncbi:MAG TPA: DUF4440 domain-containing protein [Candidatus Binatia bacterium]